MIQLLNSLDFMIMEHELESKALTYNQLRMIYSYFWDYPVQIYPQVDYVLVSKMESGLS